MKYIRTKDKIYSCELIGIDEASSNKAVYGIYKLDCKPIYQRDIIAQADTIEELCDLYVIWLKNRELPLIERTQKGRRLYPSYFETSECHFDKGYGAIWTDKGLIYVAKMNNKGELELL